MSYYDCDNCAYLEDELRGAEREIRILTTQLEAAEEQLAHMPVDPED